jgi:hypothetical protein
LYRQVNYNRLIAAPCIAALGTVAALAAVVHCKDVVDVSLHIDTEGVKGDDLGRVQQQTGQHKVGQASAL